MKGYLCPACVFQHLSEEEFAVLGKNITASGHFLELEEIFLAYGCEILTFIGFKARAVILKQVFAGVNK